MTDTADFEAVRALHLAKGARCTLTEHRDDNLPEGWSIAVRRWGPTSYDAVMLAPPGDHGWRLAGDLVPTEGEAIRRATIEILRHCEDPRLFDMLDPDTTPGERRVWPSLRDRLLRRGRP